MYSVDSLEYAIGELYHSGIGENSGLSADEVAGLLDSIDFHALLQAVRHHAETVFTFATQGNQSKSFNYRGRSCSASGPRCCMTILTRVPPRPS